jgi:hypothetical protein
MRRSVTRSDVVSHAMNCDRGVIERQSSSPKPASSVWAAVRKRQHADRLGNHQHPSDLQRSRRAGPFIDVVREKTVEKDWEP